MSTEQSLFRSAVRQQRLEPTAVVRRTTPILISSAVAAALFVALIVVLLTTRYKETEQARGILESRSPTQKIVSPASGRIVEWHVAEGDRVQAGQTLATISRSLYDDEGKLLSGIMVEELQEKRALIVDELALLSRQFEQESIQLGQMHSSSEQALQLLAGEKTLGAEQLLIAERQLSALQTLMKNSNATSRFEIERQQLQILQLRREQQGIERQFQQQMSEVENLDRQRDHLQLRQELDLLPLRKELVNLDQRIRQASRTDNFVVVAEQPGRISAIAIAAGQPVRAEQTLAQIGAANNDLIAVVYVPSSVAGKLSAGQEILLSFDAFDFHQYGRYSARVNTISAASVDPREQLLPVPGLNEPVFRLTATIDQHYVEGPDVYALQSGLLFNADFVLEELTLLQFIFKPVLSLRGRVA